MTLQLWLAFAAASSILLVIPGPTILTVISYSVAHGPKANIPLVLAVALGDSTALLLSLLGLGALLATSASWFIAIKWIGGLYLLYLGIRLLLADASPLAEAQESERGSRWKLVFSTWLVTALNPKGIVFFVAFLPQFVDTQLAVAPQLWILSATFVLLASINAGLYALFANRARELLRSPRAYRRFNLTGGSLLSLAGLWSLTVRQNA